VRSVGAIVLVAGTSCEILVYDFLKYFFQDVMPKMDIAISFNRPLHSGSLDENIQII
jgi:hypothetical protein